MTFLGLDNSKVKFIDLQFENIIIDLNIHSWMEQFFISLHKLSNYADIFTFLEGNFYA